MSEFQQLEFLDHGRETQLQVVKKSNKSTEQNKA